MITIVSPDLKRLAAGAKVFPKPLRASMRKQLTVIGREAQRDTKAKIRSMPSKGGSRYKPGSRLARFDAGLFDAEPGLRATIASAIKVSATANTVSGVGLRIYVADTAGLQSDNRATVAKYLDSRDWRHPVYGNRNAWVSQSEYPYFKTIIERKAPEMLAAAEVALREAVLATMPNVR